MGEEDEEMIEQVRGLGNDPRGIVAHGGNDGLDSLFAELLRDPWTAAGEELGGVGSVVGRGPAGLNDGLESVENVVGHAGAVGQGGAGVNPA